MLKHVKGFTLENLERMSNGTFAYNSAWGPARVIAGAPGPTQPHTAPLRSTLHGAAPLCAYLPPCSLCYCHRLKKNRPPRIRRSL